MRSFYIERNVSVASFHVKFFSFRFSSFIVSEWLDEIYKRTIFMKTADPNYR